MIARLEGCDFAGFTGRLAKQARFACSRALNDSAWYGKQAEERRIASGSVFRLRNSWTAKGMRVQNSTKRDLVATVYHLDQRMSLQETGGQKRAKGPAKGLGTWRPSGPMLSIHPEGVNLARALTRSQRPAAMLARPRTFIQSTRNGAAFIAQRLAGRQEGHRLTRKGTARKVKARGFRVLFWLTPRPATLRPRLELRRTVYTYAVHMFQPAFTLRMQEAMA